MIIYVDYPEYRGFITRLGDYIGLLSRFPGALISSIVIVGGVELTREYFEEWARITGNVRIAEDTYAEVASYIKGVSNERDLVDLVLRAYAELGSFTDIVALSNALKIFLNISILDLGLAIIYENPLLVANGLRVDMRIGDALARRMMNVGGLNVNTALVMQQGAKSMVDWGNPGVIPASNVVGSEDVSDPAFTAMAFNVMLTTRPSGHVNILSGQLGIGEYECGGVYAIAPSTLNRTLLAKFMGLLKEHGVDSTPVNMGVLDALRCLGVLSS